MPRERGAAGFAASSVSRWCAKAARTGRSCSGAARCGRFSPKQIALVETFARQAAIAVDNVRLFNETKEALEQQTAISEILRVISSSPTDVQPVLDAVAERAAHLCDAPVARVLLVDGDVLRPLAQYPGDSASTPADKPDIAEERLPSTGVQLSIE